MGDCEKSKTSKLDFYTTGIISKHLHIIQFAKLGQSHVTIYIELYLTRTQMANNLTQELYILLLHNCGGLALSLHPTFKVNVKMFTEFTHNIHSSIHT